MFLSVIDNYGDIGFCFELIMAWRRMGDFTTEFVIWTDSVEHVSNMFDMNHHVLGNVYVRNLSLFWKERHSSLAFSLFHAPIPDMRFFVDHALVFRIDYLSFDPVWVNRHGVEHITSTKDLRIIEIVPSPLGWGWQFDTYHANYSREYLAEKYSLDTNKKWISLFAYQNTIKDILVFDTIIEDYQILVFWYKWENLGKDIFIMPWVSIDIWHACIDESVWIMARGEVSAMAALCRWKLWFWDMYKQIGGFHAEQSRDFLSYIGTGDDYINLHLRLNGQISWQVLFSELDAYIQKKGIPSPKIPMRIHNLIEEMKKCIDSHEFSI